MKNGQGDTLLGVDMNQKIDPDDLIDGGTAWEALGEVQVTDDSLMVDLSDNANGYVIADAIRIEPVGVSVMSQSFVQISDSSSSENAFVPANVAVI
ncbi:hypothetical protein CY0110_12412 [Crocosphaera chwakensis CCY0110]|uniref:Uncharacterized protein n=1 Tax=Crocosphaera chwakensis CCY0110 TaxID=391612 RepID=A3IXX0_9CHRO|nr:hypothetical protein [Crocosphaera chwakensis]EAZ88683.1 hypothetical protein CY0110_12412 [Crocosphaera chwakensis CCY0110]